MKIGIIAQGKNCADVLDEVLKPWIELFQELDIHICLVTSTFKEMEKIGEPIENIDGTWNLMESYASRFHKNISAVRFENYTTEAESRERARQVLMAKDIDVDLIWLLDLSDEFYTKEQILNILKFVKSESFCAWFGISFKNYIFDKKTYLKKPFTPPRIWRTQLDEYKLSECIYDNDFSYKTGDGSEISDKRLPNYIIPHSYAWIKHYTWLNDERSRKKVMYQNHHFSHGAGCFLDWVDDQLVWNKSYFEKTKEPVPEVIKELD